METTTETAKKPASKFDEALFREALAKPRLQAPVPQYLDSNRSGGRIRVKQEEELRAMTTQWFVDFDERLQRFSRCGTDLSWMMEWAKKYWWSWLMRDMSMNHELYAPDLKYLDPTTFGRQLVGLDEFVAYNFAFFDAIPDWRYDPLPGQVFFDVTPEGEARIMIRYVGSGHFSGSLRFHPFDETAPVLHGPGTFVQCTAVDRYHFNRDGLMVEGETLWDFIDATQTAGVMPSSESVVFKALLGASKLARLRKR